jgi:hypothetical protein
MLMRSPMPSISVGSYGTAMNETTPATIDVITEAIEYTWSQPWNAAAANPMGASINTSCTSVAALQFRCVPRRGRLSWGASSCTRRGTTETGRKPPAHAASRVHGLLGWICWGDVVNEDLAESQRDTWSGLHA